MIKKAIYISVFIAASQVLAASVTVAGETQLNLEPAPPTQNETVQPTEGTSFFTPKSEIDLKAYATVNAVQDFNEENTQLTTED